MEGLPQATVRIVESNNRRADASAAQPFGRRDSRAAAEVVWFLTVSSVVGPVVRDPCKTEFLRQSVDASDKANPHAVQIEGKRRSPS